MSFEGVDEFLDGGVVEIGIVGVELDSVLAAPRVMDRYVPVTAYRVPGGGLGDVDQTACAVRPLC